MVSWCTRTTLMLGNTPYVSLAAAGAHPDRAELFADTPYADMFKQDFPKTFTW